MPAVPPPRPPSPLPEVAGDLQPVRPRARTLLDSFSGLFIFNHRTNTVHAARPTDSGDLLAIPDPQAETLSSVLPAAPARRSPGLHDT